MSLQDTQVDMAPKLPPEVVVLIFSYLQKAELKPLRFVGREFNDLIIPFLFDKVYISPQYLNLEVFRNISRNPHLAKHVRELIYDATMFTLGTDKEPESNDAISGDTIYYQHTKDQEALIKSDEDVAQLHIGLQLMPDIKTVVLRDSWYDRGEYGSKPILGVAGPLSRDWDWSVQTPYSNFWGQPHASPAVKARAFRAFLVIVRAFSVTDSRIRALTLCAAHERLGMLLEVFDLCHTDFQHTLNVFQHLREIDLSFSTYRGKALNETYFKAGYMARILSSAKLLEKLALHFDMDNGRPLLPFALLFGESTIWPRLGSLVLTALHADPEELLDLFRRHHASLKHVGLSFVTIEGDQWDEAYESMQKCLQLESFVTNEPTYFLWLQLGAVKLGEFKGNWAENIHIARARSERKGMATGIWIELPDGFEMDDVRDSLVG